MNLSKKGVQAILGVKMPICMSAKEMARNLTITFFPQHQKVSNRLKLFEQHLYKAFQCLGANIIPYNKALIPAGEKAGKIRKGITIIAIGSFSVGDFPVDNIISFTDNSIITVIEAPKEMVKKLSYEEYMEIGVKLLSQYMSSIVICITKESWMIYSFNGFSPFYKLYENFEANILNNLIPKMATRTYPPPISEFNIIRLKYSYLKYPSLPPYIRDLIESGPLFEQTELFPPVKAVEDLFFKSKFYRYIASLYLDKRTGMSYGFIARQLPVELKKMVPFKKAKKDLGITKLNKDFFIRKNKIYILLEINKEVYVMEVPSVWVLMSRSGANKTSLNPSKDILKAGLVNGQMVLEVPPYIDLRGDYRPSFDVRVILSHCVANAIYGSVLANFKKGAFFSNLLENNGCALAHWHGNILPEFIPRGWYAYGEDNLPVPCGSLQAAIYAFKGKERAVKRSLSSTIEFLGDIHIEPQHGINITWKTLKELARYLLSKPFNLSQHLNIFSKQ